MKMFLLIYIFTIIVTIGMMNDDESQTLHEELMPYIFQIKNNNGENIMMEKDGEMNDDMKVYVECKGLDTLKYKFGEKEGEEVDCKIDQDLNFTTKYTIPANYLKFEFFPKNEVINESFDNAREIILKYERSLYDEERSNYYFCDDPEILITTSEGNVRHLLCKSQKEVNAFLKLIEKNKMNILREEIIVQTEDGTKKQYLLELYSDLTYTLSHHVDGGGRSLKSGTFKDYKSFSEKDRLITIEFNDGYKFKFKFDHSVDRRDEYGEYGSRSGDHFNSGLRITIRQVFINYLLHHNDGSDHTTKRLLELLVDVHKKEYERIYPMFKKYSNIGDKNDMKNIALLTNFLTNQNTIRIYEELIKDGTLSKLDICPHRFVTDVDFGEKSCGMSTNEYAIDCDVCHPDDFTLAESVLIRERILKYIFFGMHSKFEKSSIPYPEELLKLIYNAFTNKRILLDHIKSSGVVKLAYFAPITNNEKIYETITNLFDDKNELTNALKKKI